MPASSLPLLGLGARALTVLRLLAIAPFGWLLVRALEEPASPASVGLAALFVAIATSDFVDGRLARAAGSASDSWGRVDATADVLFNTVSLGVASWLSLLGPWLPIAVAVLGGRYLVRSLRAQRGSPLASDPLGRIAGVLFYAVVGLVVAEVVWGVIGREALSRLGDLATLYAVAVFARGMRRRGPPART